MKIKVTVGELAVMPKALQDLVSAKNVPAGTGFQFARLAKKLGEEIELVLKRQVEIMRKYKAEETEEGGLSLNKDNPDFAKARGELNSLFAEEVFVNADVVTIPKNAILEPSTLLILEKFVKVAK